MINFIHVKLTELIYVYNKQLLICLNFCKSFRYNELDHFAHLSGPPDDDAVKPEKTLTVAPKPYPDANESSILGNLEKYTEYYITVLCYTHPGDGVRSQSIKIRTLEDGKLQIFLIYGCQVYFMEYNSALAF